MRHVRCGIVIIAIALVSFGCSPSPTNGDDYVCHFQAADEDYMNFGTMGGFMNSLDWSIIERVKLPSGASTSGWHMFRGKAWADKEGDVAIELDAARIYAWVYSSGWKDLNYPGTFQENQWYDICILHDAAGSTLYLYVGGVQQDTESVGPIDDSSNTNRFFFGGQDVAVSFGQGDLYSEGDITIAHQAWFQRQLTLTEIQNYSGAHFSGVNLFFETQINAASIDDASGNGHDGTNGNSPVYEPR
jgi:hypothetical protein